MKNRFVFLLVLGCLFWGCSQSYKSKREEFVNEIKKEIVPAKPEHCMGSFISPEEYKIYSILIDSLYSPEKSYYYSVILDNRTNSFNFHPEYFSENKVDSNLVKLFKSQFEHFGNREYCLNPDSIKLNCAERVNIDVERFKNIWLSKENKERSKELGDIRFSYDIAWSILYEKYSRLGGILSFSRVAMDDKKENAFLYMNAFQIRGGTDRFIYLNKVNGVWRYTIIREVSETWD